MIAADTDFLLFRFPCRRRREEAFVASIGHREPPPHVGAYGQMVEARQPGRGGDFRSPPPAAVF